MCNIVINIAMYSNYISIITLFLCLYSIFLFSKMAFILSTDLAWSTDPSILSSDPFDLWPLTLHLIPLLKTIWWLSACFLQPFYNPTFPYQHCQLRCTHHVIWNVADYADFSHPFALSLSLHFSPHPSIPSYFVPCQSLAVEQVQLESVTRQNEDVRECGKRKNGGEKNRCKVREHQE